MKQSLPPAKSVLPVNRVRSLNESIFGAYKKIYTENSEEHLTPEYRVRSDEGETKPDESEKREASADASHKEVHAIHITGGDSPKIERNEKISLPEFCPECCINELLEHEGEEMLTAEDMDADYAVAIDKEKDTIVIRKNDDSEMFVFVIH